MPKWICKVTRCKHQYRITIPYGLIEFRAWFDAKYVMLEDDGENPVTIKEFLDAKSLENEGSRDKPGPA